MSSSSDCSAVRRPSRPDVVAQDQPGSRRGSRYEIYGTATRPFGESYRRSLLLQSREQEQDQDQDQFQVAEPTDRDTASSPEHVASSDSPLDTDSVEDDMGCSTSRGRVLEETKGTFQATAQLAEQIAKTDVKIYGVMKKNFNNNSVHKYKGLSDFEIIYGSESPNKNSIDEGYSTTDIYSEVKKPEKQENKPDQNQNIRDQTPREKLMQQIRDRRDEDKEEKTNGYCTFSTIEKPVENEIISENKTENKEVHVTSKKIDDSSVTNKLATSEPVSFVEEEYSYEPGMEEVKSKLVVRSRSLVNLDQTPANYNVCTLNRPNKLKITTKPDGTIRYGLRQECSETDGLEEESPPVESGVKSNYVRSLKSAFDAAVESKDKERDGRAEAFDGLRQYFHDNKHGLQELLVNNNVVIIEPFRPSPPKSPSETSDTGSQRTCRITGATIKSPNSEQKPFILSNTLPRRSTKSNRPTKQGFYHPIKVNKELIDAELPDPDKVKNAKELFEKIFKSRNTPETPKKNTPRSFFNTITSKMRITPEVKVVQDVKQNDKKKSGHLLDEVKRFSLQRRWTDSGSLSSGVSSDLSCDQDCDYYQHDSSDDDLEYIYPYDDTETHPVSSEVLQKIRACGTSVTYYGGRIIARSHGPLRSPMTMTIMDEIRRHGGTHEGRKRFEEEPSLGVKFRLVKSHSCGSRLEIAGTEEDAASRGSVASPRLESLLGESIAEEDNHTSLEEEEDKAEADRYPTTDATSTTTETVAPPVMTWAELKLKEARRLWHCAPEAVRAPPQDMEFETFEVLEDPQPHKQDKSETGRG